MHIQGGSASKIIIDTFMGSEPKQTRMNTISLKISGSWKPALNYQKTIGKLDIFDKIG